MRRRWGGAVLAVGVVMVGVGYLWPVAAPTPDANIGAGLLVLLGWLLAVLGLLLVAVALLLARRRAGVRQPPAAR